MIAVDQPKVMLDEMKRKLVGVKGIQYRVGDARQLPFPDAVVDYVIANMYLHHVEVPMEPIQEMIRILKPDGQLVITNFGCTYF